MKRPRRFVGVSVCISIAMTLLFSVVPLQGALAAAPPAPYSNGFESVGDAAIDPGYVSADPMFDVTRVPSPTDGVTASSGSYFAEAASNDYDTGALSQFTRFGGYSSTFPAGGYTTSIDVYLDMSQATGSNDLRFDWSSAISNPSGTHRRDFIFSVGTDPTTAGQFIMSASNNAPGWPSNPGRDPFTVSTSGWYTLQHRFYDSGGGVLAVDMSVLSGTTVLKTWTLSDLSDIIGSTVGGNRYGWLVYTDFPFLALDNITRSGRCTSVCYVDAAAGNDANSGVSLTEAKATIQAAIDTVDAGGQVRVLPGTYNESAPNSNPTTIAGTYQFGLFFPSSKPGITLMGVTGVDVPITNPALTQATINTDATNNFGYDGMFVEAANTTIQGVKIGPNVSGDNKTIEVVADNFTLQDSTTAIPGGGGSIYIDDFSAGGTVVQSYHVLHNIFPDGTSVDISSGAGSSTALGASNREILNNKFDLGGGNWNAVSFNGSGTAVPWFVNTVGGAVIKGNSFTGGSLQYIRARGIYPNAQFDWLSFWNDNTYNKGAVALVTESPFDVRSFTYTVNSGSCGGTTCTFNDVRRIGATIGGEVGNTQAGDTVLVKAGTYDENDTPIDITKSLTISGPNAGISPNTGVRVPEAVITSLGNLSGTPAVFRISGGTTDVTFQGLKFDTPTAPMRDDSGDTITLRQNIFTATGGANDGMYFEDPVLTLNDNLFTGIDTPNADTLQVGGHYPSSIHAISITDNVWDTITSSGALNLSNVTGTITGNTFKNVEYYGILVANDSGNLDIRNNTFDGITNPAPSGSATWGAGVRFWEAGAGTGPVTVTKNAFTNSYLGVSVRAGSDLTSANISVTRNSIAGDNTGILNAGTGTLAATCNWYGSGSGPTNPGNPGGTGDTVTGSVTFFPWLLTSNLNGSCGNFTFLGYTSPLPKTKLAASNSTIPVKFKLGDANGSPLPASIASTLVTRVLLTGPSPSPDGVLLTAIEPCPYNSTSGMFKCNLAKPRDVQIGVKWYWITTTVKIGGTYVQPTNFGSAVNPEQVTFKK